MIKKIPELETENKEGRKKQSVAIAQGHPRGR